MAAPAVPQLLTEALHSRRWSVSSPHEPGHELFERRFAAAWADYLGVGHCVPVDHGSSALVIAFESLGLEYGDVVAVPALTWVASASAALRAGLLPVLADVDPTTGCLDASALDQVPDARVVLPVHWACGMADVPALVTAAQACGAVVVEDAATAHGARWNGRAAGTIGRIGCFSMQNSKVLAAGEAGAVVTDDDALAGRLEELRADSRRAVRDPGTGGVELTQSCTVQGVNFALGEFGAAVLCGQLTAFDEQQRIRNANYATLLGLLDQVDGVRPLRHRPEQTVGSIYEVALVVDPLPAGVTNADFAAALTAELGVLWRTPTVPLQRNRMLQPWTKPALRTLADRFRARHRDVAFTGAEYLAAHAVTSHHSTFLGTPEDMTDIVTAFGKVIRGLGR
ncbi:MULTISPECIES: DegT/DnrJ/EryC1/StrS family aminotransferase [unclassified Micromonospora]|uniref:DegT/DnrJ/EryC1/StrS family aminotransferase n=1 Tax=unclassified Micromonospora TaxID=2617518 RepID=UPI001E471D12|nr:MULTISPECIES: DegT/DnrJ/EryC1/StrS family aminotransferase [unclassified Micromonospora]MDI5936660.1 DegT/DnrJ/EryC1/StrS family aminotransferase [Micromonospora sp. DH15]